MTTTHAAATRGRSLFLGVSPKRRLTLVLIGLAVVAVVVLGIANRASAANQTLNSGNYPNGFTVPAGDTWTLNPNADTTITSGGNIIVRGTLIMKPANGDVEHLIRFTGINESNFVGGGMDPIASDVGLWVMGSGRIILEGESKPAWAYTWQSGWTGDEVRAAPNSPGNYSNFPVVTSTPAKNALGYSTELLNLTRNVRVEGTSSGYSHVFIRSTRPSTIKNAAFRYVGPDPANVATADDDRTGRYGLHIHMSGNGSRGTLVDGLVIRDTKAHAFVPHGSHGVTFRNTIAYNVRAEAYWWDEPARGVQNNSNDIVWDRTVAALVRRANSGDHHRLSGYFLGAGQNISVTNSVAVGVQNEGGANRSGYLWPEDAEGTWFFHNNRAHNNEANGIFVWQNNEMPHVIDGFIAYYNRGAGVEHGAYTNSYVYKNLILRGNGVAVHSHALGEPGDDNFTDTQIWSNVKTGGGTLLIDEHAREPERPVRFVDCDFGEVEVDDRGGPERSLYDFIRCGLEPNDFDLSGARSDSVFRVQRANGTAYRLTGTGAATSISAFYSGTVPGTPGGAPGEFTDTANSVFKDAIAWLYAQGITQGCNPPSNTRFCPNDRVTRGQMAAFLVRSKGYSAIAKDFFVDDTGHIFENAINRLRTAGITEGCNPPQNNRFCPDRFVTRGEMAAFLVRAFGYTNAGSGNYFVDDNGHIFENAINRLRVAGVTLGCNPPTNNRYCPNDYVTRGQMAAFLKRALTG
ncbi:MAG TPA: S-layer homology domain-containing protein [Acidimicrobiia bacterium]|nr:S-layer homology domain-containing protein [Acidimicrobiia bacterium]